MNLPPDLPSPCYVVDAALLERNLQILDYVQQEADVKILLALKGFAMWSTFGLVSKYLAGTTCSGIHEAKLGREMFGKEVHVYAPAFTDAEMDELLPIADHLSFNSFSQWRRLRERVAAHPRPIECGLRINPEHSEVATRLYDPCAPGSRLGITAGAFAQNKADLAGLTGLHFHTLCELGSDALERTLHAVESKFGQYLATMPDLSWINFGGGHHITREGYDVERLIRVIREFRSRHDLEIYLEPGEAIALNTGVLVATVLDLVHNDVDIAMLDTSATAHMPDVLEMPYRPRIVASGSDTHVGGEPGEKAHTYRLGGLTCLAGDVIGDWSFDRPLSIGDRLVFADMAHYTMVKNTTFNGVPLPAIAIHDSRDDSTRVVRTFGYEDYKMRLS